MIDRTLAEHHSLFRLTPCTGQPLTILFGLRFNLESQRQRASRSPRRSWELMASCGETPAGICTLFLGERYAGLFDVGVLEPLRNQGIGRTLVRYACAFAQKQGAQGAILIATNMGYRVYEHVGFKEVSRVGFWYAARP